MALLVALAFGSQGFRAQERVNRPLRLFGAKDVTQAAVSPDGTRVAIVCGSAEVRVMSTSTGKQTLLFGESWLHALSVAYSPDGKTLATGGTNYGSTNPQEVVLWDASTGAKLRALDFGTEPGCMVNRVAFSPDGSRLSAGGIADYHGAGRLMLWDTSSWAVVSTGPFSGGVLSLSFSGDGSRLAAASSGTAKVFSLPSGDEVMASNLPNIRDAALSPDGSKLAVGCDTNVLDIYDAGTGVLERTLRWYSSSLVTRSIAFSPDGTLMVVGIDGLGISLWDPSSWAERGLMRPAFPQGTSAWTFPSPSFLPDGKTLIAASRAELPGSVVGTVERKFNLLTLFDTAAAAPLRSYSPAGSGVECLALSKDGTRLAAGRKDGKAEVWDASSGARIATLVGHSGAVGAIAFSPDGSEILTGSADATAKLWDAASGVEIRTFDGHTRTVMSVAFSPDGSRVATGGFDTMTKIWSASSGQELHSFDAGAVFGTVAFSPDGASLLTATWKYLRLWNATTGELVRTFEGSAGNIAAFSPAGGQVAVEPYPPSNGGVSFIRILDVSTGAVVKTLHGGSRDDILTLAYSADGSRLLLGTGAPSAELWDVSAGTLSRFIPHSEPPRVAGFSPDGLRFFTACDSTAFQWPIESPDPLRMEERQDAFLYSVRPPVALSPDATRAATADTKVARLWDTASGAWLRDLKGHTGEIRAVSFSPDGSKLLTAAQDSTAKLWKVSDGSMIKTLTGHTDALTGGLFSPDGTKILTYSEDWSGRLWDVQTGAVLQIFNTGTNGVQDGSFSPDGRKVVLASGNSLCLYDAETGSQLWSVAGICTVVAFTPDGKRVIADATLGYRCHIAAYDAETGVRLSATKIYDGMQCATFLKMAPDGHHFAMGLSWPPGVEIWDLSTMAAARILDGHGQSCDSASFSQDGMQVLTGSNETPALLWATGLEPPAREAKPIVLGQTVQGVAPNMGFADYRLQVQAGEAANLVVRLAPGASGGTFTLLGRRGSFPTFTLYDWRGEAPLDGVFEMLIPAPGAGDFILSASYENWAQPGSGAFSMTVEAVTRHIAGVSPAEGGNAGTTTARIKGLGFEAGVRAELRSGATVVKAFSPASVEADTLVVPMDLGGLAPQTTDLAVVWPDAAESVLQQAFKITAGGTPKLDAHITVPADVRILRPATLWVEYENQGGADMPAPLFIVVSDQGLLLRHDSSDPWVRAPINFLGIDFQARGTAGTLTPGHRYRIPVQFYPEGAAHTKFTFSLFVMDPGTSAVDWATQEARFRPEWGIDPEAWGHIWAQFTASVGATWNDYARTLRASADRLSSMGRFVSRPAALLTLAMDQALAGEPRQTLAGGIDAQHPGPGLPLVFSRAYASGLATRFTLGPLGRGWTHSYDLSVREFESGDAAVWGFGGARSFTRDSSGQYGGRSGDAGRLVKSGETFTFTETNGTVYGFDGEGRLATIREYKGNTLTCTYDGSGRLASVAHSDGDHLEFSYGSDGRISRLTDASGAVTEYAYDASGEHLASVAAPGGRTLTYEYEEVSGKATDHALTAIGFPDGTHRTFTYDSAGRLSGLSRDGGEEAVSLSYGEIGEVGVTSGESQFTFVLDEAGNVGEASLPGGNRTQITRNSGGSPTRVVDPSGGRWDLTYGPLGNVTSITDPLGNSRSLDYSYPESGGARVSGVVDGNGNRTAYERGGKRLRSSGGDGAVSAFIYPDGGREEFLRDAEGMVSQYTNRRGQAILFTRNSRGQLALKVFPDGTSVTYEYDGAGRLVKAADSTGDITMDYDASGFLTKIAYPGGRWFSFARDGAGKRTRRTGDDGLELSYSYDAAGRLSRVEEGPNLVVSYKYDAAGRVAREDRGNGTAVVTTYDPLGKPISVSHTGPGGILSQLSYTYDARGNPTSFTSGEGTATYGYDGRGQLVRATEPGGRQVIYTYDSAGNRTRVVDNGTPSDYVINALNQIVSTGAETFTYDGDGNLATRTGLSGTTSFQYDSMNRLTRASGPQAGTSDLAYDAIGALSSVTRDGAATRFLYDAGGVGAAAAELSANGQVLSRAVEGLGLAGFMDGAGKMSHLGFDGMGNTRQVTDPTGSLSHSYGYSAFGETTTDSGTSPNSYRFGGRDGGRAEIPGLGDIMTNIGRQEYSASLGRCNSVDPMRFAGSTNLYSLGLDSPAKSTKKRYGAAYKHDWTGDGLNLVGVLCDQKIIPEPIGGPLNHGLNIYSLSQGFGEMTQGAETGDWQAYSHGFGSSALVIMGYFAEVCPPAQPIVKTAQLIAWVDETGTDLYIKSLGTDDPTRWYVPHNKWWYLNHNNPDGTMPEWERKFYEKSGESEGRLPEDPNEKLATPGRGANHIVTADETLSYTVHFENVPTASAPAQEVFVTDPLDANLDLTTLRFTGMGWAGTTVDITTVQPLFSARVTVPDYRPGVAKLWWVEVKAELKPSGTIQWTFRTLDPETGELPEDALAGFLPPNDSDGRGEGWVTFTAKPKGGIPNGTKITNKATIVFDVYASIDTNEVFNTIGPPPGSGSMSGSVYHDANGNGAKDTGEEGYASVAVSASMGGSTFAATTGADGQFTLTGLDEGSYSISASAADSHLPPCSHATSTNPLVVDLADGQALTEANLGFLATPPPSVTTLGTSKGLTTGGTSVTLTGTYLAGVTAVKFGEASAASFQGISATQVLAVSPPHTEGSVHITVINPCGTSAETPADLFTYAACSVNCTASASPDSGNAPLAVTFSATATPTGCTGSPSYEWLFGDGGSSTLQNPSHTYASQGTYTWVFTASADGVSCSQTGTLIVEAGCTYALSPASKVFAAKAGSANVTVTATGLATCGSPAVSASEAWVSAVVTKFAKNKGKVKVSVQANPSGAPRNAQVQIGGGIFAVSQAGAACKINALSPSQATVPGTGGEGSFAVNATGDCAWTATVAPSAASWLAVTSAPGSGPGGVTYSAGPNTTGKSRKGTLTVATGSGKKTFTLTQEP